MLVLSTAVLIDIVVATFLLFTFVSCNEPALGFYPNIVLFFADDLGYGDLSCYGAEKLQTPNIDRLAAQGRRFTDAHSVSAVCTPSRYALLTGEYPVRGNGGRGVWGPAPITSPLIVDTEKTTIADVFKRRGYETAVVGKWHLGHLPQYLPTAHGFDYYFGIPYSNDMWIGPSQRISPLAVFREGWDLDRALDEATVPRFVVGYVLYHELLHTTLLNYCLRA